jgi:hypothetical protein
MGHSLQADFYRLLRFVSFNETYYSQSNSSNPPCFVKRKKRKNLLGWGGTHLNGGLIAWRGIKGQYEELSGVLLWGKCVSIQPACSFQGNPTP